MFYLLIVCCFSASGQLLSSQEAELDSVIMHHIEGAIIDFSPSDISGSKWVHKDGMGYRSIQFSTNRYKLKWHGAHGKYQSTSGKWYIYDKYLVISNKGEKQPLFIVGKGRQVIILDEENVKILKTLIKMFVLNQQWSGYLTKDDVLSFLDGFEKEQ